MGISPIGAAMALVVIGMQVFIIQPGIVQGFVSELGLTESEAGYVASAEMFGIAGATVLCAALGSRVRWRRLCGVALGLLAAMNLLSAFVQEMTALLAARFAAGLAAGVLISLGYAVVGTAANPERAFGYLIVAVLTYSAVGLLVMPTGLDQLGMAGILISLALMALAGFGVLPRFPDAPAVSLEEPRETARGRGRGLVMLAAVTCFFLGQGVIWAYLFLIGTGMGLTAQAVATGLTVSQLAGIAGAFTAALFATRVRPLASVFLGTVCSIVPLWFLSQRLGALGYGAAVTVFNWAANLLTPLLVALVAGIERRLVQSAAALQMLGLAVGPAVAAALLNRNGFPGLLALAAGLFVLSLLLAVPPVRALASAAAVSGGASR